jgi:transcriptional regulator with GAF, ATPase, and Fis domain
MSAHTGNYLSQQVQSLLQTVQSRDVTDVDAVLGEMTDAAVELLGPAQFAGITLVNRSTGIRSASSTGPYPALLDEIQTRHGDGPCLTAAWENHMVHIDDLETETRWPAYCRDAVAETPARTVLSYQLFSDRSTMGALNFYANRPSVFDADAVELGLIVATHVALSWNLLRRDQQFRSALASRDVIGQAKGLIMERFTINAVQAFELLRRLSQQENIPLVEVARRLVADHEN